MYQFKPVATGYLYSWRNGIFKVQQGQLFLRESVFHSGRFYVNERRFYQCNAKSGVLANRVVWLPERDDEKVRDMYIQHEEKRIVQLKKAIDQCRTNILNILLAEIQE